MKKTFLFTIFIFLLCVNVYSNENQEIKYTTYKVIDLETKEDLAGVCLNINNKKYYTDFNGEIKLEPGNKANVYLISYQSKEVVLENNKKVIELKKL